MAALAGWEKYKRETMPLKKELDNALQQKASAEERLSHAEVELKECKQQLHYEREDKERRIHGAMIKASEEFERKWIALNEKLAESGKKVARIEAENSQLHTALSSKEKAIEELSKYRIQVEADLNTLVLRLDSSEKAKASLSYEVRLLEKELDIRNEETEFNRRAAEIAQRQHQESLKKNAKLDSECQRLRILVQRRLPGPAALKKMKNEVQMLGKDQVGTTRRRSNSSRINLDQILGKDQVVQRRLHGPADFHVDDAAADTRNDFLTEQLLRMEEQKIALQYALEKNSSKSQFSRKTYAQVEGSIRGETTTNPVFRKEPSLAPPSDLGSDDKASCADSWASAVISELEHIKHEQQPGTPSSGYMETPEMNLMDDFAEMEKLAIVSIDYPPTSSHHFSEEGNRGIGPLGGSSLPKNASELVHIHRSESETFISGQDIQAENTSANRFPPRLDDLLKLILEYCRALKISPREVLEDMKVALEHNSSGSMYFDVKGSKSYSDTRALYPKVSKQSSNKPFNPEASDTGNENDVSTTKRSDQKLESNVSIQIKKILELLEGMNILPQENGMAASFSGEDDRRLPYKSLEMPAGYTIRVFQWKSAELSEVLQQFFQTCNELLNRKANLEQFVQLVASSLDWIMNHCFSLQDVSSMKDTMRSHLEWDESRSESEFDSGSAKHSTDSNRVSTRREEAKNLTLEPANTDLSTIDSRKRAQSKIFGDESFKNRPENETAVQSIGNAGDQIKNLKMIEDQKSKIMEFNHEQRNTSEEISLPNNVLETKSNSFERQEETCIDQETHKKRRSSRDQEDGKPCENQLRDDREISAASEKLADCQETILKLGKQLKALASPQDAALFDTAISSQTDYVMTSKLSPKRKGSKRLSLLDNLLAEDTDQIGASLITTDHIENGNSNSTVDTDVASKSWNKFTVPDASKGEADKKANFSMAIIPPKKKERSFLKKLFQWQKKGDRKKTLFS